MACVALMFYDHLERKNWVEASQALVLRDIGNRTGGSGRNIIYSVDS